MIRRTIEMWIAAALGVAVVDTAAAQASRVELSGAYQNTGAAEQTLPFGWSADIGTNLNRTWSVIGEVSGAYRSKEDEDLGADVRLSLHSLGAGARWSGHVGDRIIPFLQVLAGAARASARTEILGREVGSSSTKFMLQPGGGVALKLNETFAILGQVDYRRVFLDDEEDRASGQNQFRVLAGVRVGL
jgi:opacity protein-like surface antigen